MAPKIESPFESNISIRIVSPNFMNDVEGLPSAMISSMRISAKQDAPLPVSSLAMVPEPTMVPAVKGRVLTDENRFFLFNGKCFEQRKNILFDFFFDLSLKAYVDQLMRRIPWTA